MYVCVRMSCVHMYVYVCICWVCMYVCVCHVCAYTRVFVGCLATKVCMYQRELSIIINYLMCTVCMCTCIHMCKQYICTCMHTIKCVYAGV